MNVVAAASLLILSSDLKPSVNAPASQNCDGFYEICVPFTWVEPPTTEDLQWAVPVGGFVWLLTRELAEIDPHRTNLDAPRRVITDCGTQFHEKSLRDHDPEARVFPFLPLVASIIAQRAMKRQAVLKSR